MSHFVRQLKSRSVLLWSASLFAAVGCLGLAGCSHNSSIAPAGASGLAPSQATAINNLPPAMKAQAMQQAQFGQSESAAMLAQSKRQMEAERKK